MMSDWNAKVGSQETPGVTGKFGLGIQMDNKHIKKYSISLVIREMQIKTAMRCHLTLVRMAIIKKSTNNKCWRGCEVKEILLLCW